MRNLSGVAAAELLSRVDAPDPTAMLLVLSGPDAFAIRFHAEGRQQELRAMRPR